MTLAPGRPRLGFNNPVFEGCVTGQRTGRFKPDCEGGRTDCAAKDPSFEGLKLYFVLMRLTLEYRRQRT